MRILLTGGSACGKSTFAEALTLRFPLPRYYLATMRPFSDEARVKIARHHEMRREKGFETIERDVDVAGVTLPPASTVLLECLCNLTANELFDEEGSVDAGAPERILKGIADLESRCENLIVVTNDVGSGSSEAYDASTQLYVEKLGHLNAVLATRFDIVYELVCGIPLLLKSEGAGAGAILSVSPCTPAIGESMSSCGTRAKSALRQSSDPLIDSPIAAPDETDRIAPAPSVSQEAGL